MKKTIINLICSLLLLITNLLVGFFLSPFIVKNIGVEANGFVTLANNCVMYATLIVTALNSMAARYISIAYVKKEYEKARMYYNSVFWGNLLIVAVLIIPALICLFKLDSIFNIPSDIVLDVKILFAFVFFNFFITTGLPNWDCGTFVSNRLDRSYIPQVFAAIARCSFLLIIFTLFSPKVYYIGISSTIVVVINLIANFYNTKTLTPFLKIRFKKIICSWKAIKELVFSGIWNSINSIGVILLTGIDLVICNLYLGATNMGILSLSKIFSNYMDQLAAAVTNSFAPEITINYANGNKDKLIKDLGRSIKLSSIILTTPIVIFIVFGKAFYELWIPSQDAKLLQFLSILASFKFIFTAGIQILYNVFPTVNKVKESAISQIITGIISITLTIIVVKYTRFGLYAVAGVSSFCALTKNLLFVTPACSKYLEIKWYTFYKHVFISFFSSTLIIIVGLCINSIVNINSWIKLIIVCILMGIVSLIVNYFITLNTNEKKYLKDKILKKIKKQSI